MKDIERNVNWGIDRVAPDRRIEIPLTDALYVFKVLGEFVSFFHQPANYPTLDEVEKFLGDVDNGAFHVLREAYYNRMRNIWPRDIEDMFDSGELDRNPFCDP